MKLNMIQSKTSRLAKRIRWYSGLLAFLMLFGRASGQTAVETPQRWLLIFDTSVTMERWLPGTTTEMQNLFFDSMSGQLQAGDSVGVWVFADKLHTDKVAPFTWLPGKAAEASSRLTDFLDYEHYSGKTRFAVLGPVLRRIIADSQRLTIVIFCDGKDELNLTPYDANINHTFSEMQADRKKNKVPFVLVVRTQNGKFIGATVNLPPGSLDFPTFPPLPVSAGPGSTKAPVAPAGAEPAPTISAPPLVIVGTNVLTNSEAIKKVSGP